MKTSFKIIAFALVFISCKESSEKQEYSNNIEEAEKILSERSSYSQTITKFSDFLCHCIETEKTTDNFTALNSRYDHCAMQYINKYKDEVSELVLLLDSNMEEKKSEYKNGKATGSIIAREGNIILARECTFFQTEFEKIKQEIAKSIGATPNNYESKITILNDKIKESKSKQEIQQIASIIGVVYELNEKYVEARQSYRRGGEIKSNQNINLIFLELLKAKK